MSAPAEGLPLLVLDSVTDYEKIHRLGEGTYGVVYKAKDRRTGEVVALKKVRFDRARDGVPVTSIRELRVLQECRHPNIVQLKKVVTGSKADSMFLVFEYCEHDMGRLLDALPRPFSLQEIKCLMLQLLEAVAFLHSRWVMHRDIKMSNLLYTRQGHLKLCDFGLARYFQPFPANMTPRVVTLWYRAPEVLLGAEVYDEAVDMWAVGCVFGELLRHSPLFPASSELECLRQQCALLGSPTTRIWPGMAQLPFATQIKLPEQPHSRLAGVLGPALGNSAAGVELLSALLTYDPARRITAAQALRHAFFTERPYPRMITDMPVFPSLVDGASGAVVQHHHHHHHGQIRQHQGAGPHQQRVAGQKRPGEPFDHRRSVLSARERDREQRFGDAFEGR